MPVEESSWHEEHEVSVQTYTLRSKGAGVCGAADGGEDFAHNEGALFSSASSTSLPDGNSRLAIVGRAEPINP